jgi:capsular exopolysaccharide synthesis family protein
VELKRYVQLLWRGWLIILICAVAAGLSAWFMNAQRTQLYSSSTTLLANAAARGTAPFSESMIRTSEQLLGTYVELFLKRPVLQETVNNLQLNRSPEALAGQVKVVVIPNTLLIRLTVEDRDPQMAANIANEMVRVLNGQEEQLLANPFVGYRQALNVVEAAQPGAPVNQRGLESIILAMLIGAAAAVAALLLRENLDDTVRSRDDAERVTEAPILAAITPIRGSYPAEKLVTVTDQQSPVAEAYRMFRAHIEYPAVESSVKTLLVTSSDPNEGKSTTAANLAVALAQAGKRVILVDMDLRRPTLHKFFKRTNQRGVTTALNPKQGETVMDHLVSTGVDNLQLLASGPIPTNPAGLFGSTRMLELIEDLRSKADLVIFDSPSILTVVDAALLARSCDATVLVAQHAATKADRLKRARDQVVLSGTNLLGLVLNRVEASQAGDNYYYAEDGTRKRLTLLRRIFPGSRNLVQSPETAGAADSKDKTTKR